MNIIEKDSEIKFPEVRIVRASAGSGKTWALTLRFVQLLLSEHIRGNHPLNIIALTFSNNAAREMKERIFRWLKEAVLSPYSEETEKLAEVLSITDRETLQKKAEAMLEELLDNYSELQVMTIDSFLTTLFKASSIELGIPPDFDIELNREELFRYCFDLFIRDLIENSEKRSLLEDTIERILKNQRDNSAYLWNPAERLVKEFIDLHGKLTSYKGQYHIIYKDDEIEKLMEKCKELIEEMFQIINKEGFEEYKRSNLKKIQQAINEKRYPDLLNFRYDKLTVKKPKKPSPAFDRLESLWEDIKKLVVQYAGYYIETFYSPYLTTYSHFIDTLEETKRLLGRILIDDISYMLSRYLTEEIVPDVFLRYGERINHFLIDEFQDTSPLQWHNLSPLIENSLSEGGSLFVVGDTKQAIYGFRNADYRIMKAVEKQNPFPSASHAITTLDKNYRSCSEILSYVEEVFKRRVPESPYLNAASLSGLTDYIQHSARDDTGYVEVVEVQKDEQSEPEKDILINRILDMKTRGYQNRDIAILTMENYDVVKISSWLSEAGIPFLSYSSLDIRKRKITSEIISLLEFLDAPTNDFAFSEFLLSKVFMRALESRNLEDIDINRFLFETRQMHNRYLIFRQQYPDVWNTFFDGLFKLTGYMPLYDLIVEVLRVFNITENFQDEEATIVRLLEVVKEFEKKYGSDTQRFLSEFKSTSDKEIWNITVPEGTNAVKVMTVHKSKGLGFEAVVLVLYERWRNQGFPYIITGQKDDVRILKINRNLLSINSAYEPLYQEEFYRRQTDDLNALYVSLTRAKRELHLLCVKDLESNKYPFDILPCPYRSSDKKPFTESKETDEVASCLYHPEKSPMVFKVQKGDIDISARRRGEFIHALLAAIQYYDQIETEGFRALIRKYIERFMIGQTVNEVYREISDFMLTPEIKPFFEQKNERTVLTEQEMVDRWGNLFRVDRMIIDPEVIYIIDFKTGMDIKDAKMENYIDQIKRYIFITKRIYKYYPVRGYIISFDDREIIYEV